MPEDTYPHNADRQTRLNDARIFVQMGLPSDAYFQLTKEPPRSALPHEHAMDVIHLLLDFYKPAPRVMGPDVPSTV